MPVYIHLANLILDKQAVERKYSGGLDQFRKDYDICKEGPSTEDNEIFSLAIISFSLFCLICSVKSTFSA
jgi:hypothetical protein